MPTATFRVLFVLVVLSHRRCGLANFDVTEHPTAEWTVRQLIEACGQEESARHLIRLSTYVAYYNGTLTHLSLAKDAPEPRSVQPPIQGRVVEVPRVGGLHHEYVRRAA